MKIKANKLFLLSLVFFTAKGMLYLFLGKYFIENTQWSHWFFIPIIIILISILWMYFNKKSNPSTGNYHH